MVGLKKFGGNKDGHELGPFKSPVTSLKTSGAIKGGHGWSHFFYPDGE